MSGYLIGPSGVLPAAGSTFDPATTAWVNAVVAAGGAVSATQQARVNTLIVALKGHGLFSTFDRIWLWGGESSVQQSTIDIVNLATLTVTNSPVLSAAGYTGNGGTTSLGSGITPSAFTGNYTLNSASFAFYETDNGVASNANAHGTAHAVPTTYIYTYAFATLSAYAINNGAFNTNTNAAATTQGMWGVSRTTANATALYRNGGSTPVSSNGSDAVTTMPTSEIQWLAGDGANNTATLAMGAISQGMSGADWANFAADINAYMTSWGINVF